MLTEGWIALGLFIVVIIVIACRLDDLERETERWNARHALREHTWDEVERIDYITTDM